MCLFAIGNLCFAACAPSAWGLHGPRARQLEAQSVEGVRCSVVGGRPDPRRHPDTTCPRPLSSDQDVLPGRPGRGTDSSAQPNPHDAVEEEEGGDWRDTGGEEVVTSGREERRERSQRGSKNSSRAERHAGTLPTAERGRLRWTGGKKGGLRRSRVREMKVKREKSKTVCSL